ncbi:MAG: hypothetical protein AAGB15_02120 [Pseudomonadota bacterium]
MTNDQIAAKLHELSTTIDAEFDKVNTRLDQTVSKSDVNAAVLQGLAFASAAIVGTIVVLNALGAFS